MKANIKCIKYDGEYWLAIRMSDLREEYQRANTKEEQQPPEKHATDYFSAVEMAETHPDDWRQYNLWCEKYDDAPVLARELLDAENQSLKFVELYLIKYPMNPKDVPERFKGKNLYKSAGRVADRSAKYFKRPRKRDIQQELPEQIPIEDSQAPLGYD